MQQTLFLETCLAPECIYSTCSSACLLDSTHSIQPCFTTHKAVCENCLNGATRAPCFIFVCRVTRTLFFFAEHPVLLFVCFWNKCGMLLFFAPPKAERRPSECFGAKECVHTIKAMCAPASENSPERSSFVCRACKPERKHFQG